MVDWGLNYQKIHKDVDPLVMEHLCFPPEISVSCELKSYQMVYEGDGCEWSVKKILSESMMLAGVDEEEAILVKTDIFQLGSDSM